MSDSAYKRGFERGEAGYWHSGDILESLLDSPEERESRQAGWQAGLLARAIKGE